MSPHLLPEANTSKNTVLNMRCLSVVYPRFKGSFLRESSSPLRSHGTKVLVLLGLSLKKDLISLVRTSEPLRSTISVGIYSAKSVL